MKHNIDKQICVGEGIYRFEANKITFLLDKKRDDFLVGFLNVDKMTFDDLKLINEMTSEMIKLIENEEQ